MFIKVYSLDNVELEQIEINDNLFPEVVRQDIIKLVIELRRAKDMSGCHKSKTISEVSGGGRKPFAQKGTGRARQGSTRSPQMRGGSTVHGPVVRSHQIFLPKKVRKLGLRHALASKYQAQKMIVVDQLVMPSVSSKELAKKISWINGKNILFVDQVFDSSFGLSCRNNFALDVIPDCGINVYDIIRHEHLVITKSSLKILEGRLLV
jgi:large subunit ribosomal protein L4